MHILCPGCSKIHEIEYGKTRRLVGGEWVECEGSKLLGFYKCNEKLYLGTINGEDITRRRPENVVFMENMESEGE